MKLEPRERKQIIAFETSALLSQLERASKKASPKKPKQKKASAAVTLTAKKAKAPVPKKLRRADTATASSQLLKSKSSSSSSTLLSAPTADEVPLTRQQSAKRDRLFREGVTTHKWQYKNDQSRWADYDKKASDEVERAYASWLVNPHIDVRSVHSGDWDYMVDFNMMTQQNVRHHAHKVRQIQRVPIGA